MKRSLVFAGIVACGAPHPTPHADPAPPPAIDAAPAVIVDAAIDAPPDVAPDAQIDAPELPCWEQGRTGQAVQVLRVHVRSGGSVEVRKGIELWSVDVAEMDILEVISGDMSEVPRPFRKSLYAAKEISFCDVGVKQRSCGDGFADPQVSALIAAKGEDRIIVVALPPQGSTGGVMVPRLRAKYGLVQPTVFRVCPIP
jgi:hypothetical protein